jgi:Putative NADP-dependent oxidoreductases
MSPLSLNHIRNSKMSIPKESNCFILNEKPRREVNYNLEDEHSTFKLIKKPLGELQEGQILIKSLYLSNDPSQRAWIQKGLVADRMYTAPVNEGEPMRSTGLGMVIDSKDPNFKQGEVLNCDLKWADYVVINKRDVFNKIPDADIPLTWYLDVLGFTGLTAYFGLLQVANLKKSDTIVISAASGATGSMCIQIAKNIVGCKKVIGISGGPEKCKYVESIGADICVDYRDPDLYNNMKKALGDDKYCDVFFDGVGGKVLDTMLNLTKPFGTVVACGTIAGYNDAKKSGIYSWGQIVTNRITVKGFIVLDFAKQYKKAIGEILSWIKEGKIAVSKSSFTLIDLSAPEKFVKIPETWGLLFSDSKGPGKLLTKISDPKL